MLLATLLICVGLQAVQPSAPPQPRYPVDATTGRAIGATEIDPEAVKAALGDGRPVVIIDTRPAEAFEKETLPGAINIPLAELDARLTEFSKDTFLVFT